MKKIFYSLFAAAVVLSACNESLIEEAGTGQLVLDLSASDSYVAKTKASSNEDKNEFKVDIVRKADGFKKSYARFGDMGSVVELPSGAYTISVSSPNTLPAAFDQPIYGADHDFVVKVGEVSSENIECTLRNMKVSFNLTDAFKRELSTYTITVSNGDAVENTLYWENVSSSANQYTTTDISKAGYFTVAPLTVRVDGKRAVDGSEAYHEIALNDGKARDHFIITLDAKVTGNAGFQIDIIRTLNERDEDVYVPGFDETPVPGGSDESGDSSGDNTGSGDDNTGSGDGSGDDSGESQHQDMTMTWEGHESVNNVYPSADIDGSDVNLMINVPGKIAGFVVQIDSESPEFMEVIPDMTSDGSNRLDLINDPVAIAAMKADGIELITEDLKGKTEVPFNLTGLLPMISFVAESGTNHVFTLTVTDEAGYSETWKLTFYLP